MFMTTIYFAYILYLITKKMYIINISSREHASNSGSSVVGCRTRNQVSPGSNPPLLPFRRLGISILSIDASVPGEDELVSAWTGLPGGANCVKRFERSNGLDTALYKNYFNLFLHSKHGYSYSDEKLNFIRDTSSKHCVSLEQVYWRDITGCLQLPPVRESYSEEIPTEGTRRLVACAEPLVLQADQH